MIPGVKIFGAMILDAMIGSVPSKKSPVPKVQP